MSTCLGFCLFVSNLCQNGLTNWARIFCVTSYDAWVGFEKCLPKIFCFHKSLTNFKIQELF